MRTEAGLQTPAGNVPTKTSNHVFLWKKVWKKTGRCRTFITLMLGPGGTATSPDTVTGVKGAGFSPLTQCQPSWLFMGWNSFFLQVKLRKESVQIIIDARRLKILKIGNLFSGVRVLSSEITKF